MQHFFDGLGMLHKFDIADGKVVHLSRYTADGVARQAKKDGYINTLLMFGSNANPPPEVMAAANAQLGDAQDPCQALLGRQVTILSRKLEGKGLTPQQQAVFVPKGYLEPDGINANVMPRRSYHVNSDGNPLSKAGADKPEIKEVQFCSLGEKREQTLLNLLDHGSYGQCMVTSLRCQNIGAQKNSQFHSH